MLYSEICCLFSDPHETHKYAGVSRMYNFTVLNVMVHKVTTGF